MYPQLGCASCAGCSSAAPTCGGSTVADTAPASTTPLSKILLWALIGYAVAKA